jgi:hypothetical protein
MFVGGTNRGWGGGSRPYSLERLVWTGKVPFEIHEMHVKSKGFRLTFTQPVDPAAAGDVKSYAMRCWTYKYHSGYGDPPRELQSLAIRKATVAKDGLSVELEIDGLKPYYVHELRLNGVRNSDGQALLHPEAYYTLNRIPK